jgi:hypothetical protein
MRMEVTGVSEISKAMARKTKKVREDNGDAQVFGSGEKKRNKMKEA